MWSTPSSIARRSTARAASRSRGGPNTPGPASCIAPNPMRRTSWSPSFAVWWWVMPTACASASARQRVEQAREALVEIGAAQRDVALRALGAGAGDAGLAEEAQVVRTRRRREAQRRRQVAAQPRAVVGQQAHEVEAHGVAEDPQDRRHL